MDESPVRPATTQTSAPRSAFPAAENYRGFPEPGRYVSARRRADTLRVAHIAMTAASVIAALAALERFSFAVQTLRLGAFAPGRFDAVSRDRSIADVLFVLAAAATIVAWLAWFARVYRNIRPLGAAWTRVSPPLAVVSCAVPLLNLFMAPWLCAEVWRTSDPGAGEHPHREDAGSPPLLLVVWPVVGVLALVAAVVGLKVSHHSMAQLRPVRSGSPFEFAGAVLAVPALAITARLTTMITARQDDRAADLASAT